MRAGGAFPIVLLLSSCALVLLAARSSRHSGSHRETQDKRLPGEVQNLAIVQVKREPAIARATVTHEKRAWDKAFLSRLSQATEGDHTEFELAGGEIAIGKIGFLERTNGEVLYVSGKLTAPEPGRFFFQKQTRTGVAGAFVGVVEFPASQKAYRIEPAGAAGAPEFVEHDLDEIMCVGLPVPGPSGQPIAEIPPLNPGSFPDLPIPPYQNGILVLESLHGATAVIYLDFQGGYTPTWGGVTYARPAVSNDQIREVWQRVAEDFMPFTVNVTTDLKVFQNAPQGSRQRVIITPTMFSGGAEGGVAYIGSFNFTGDVPCWVFLTSGKPCAEACSHEAGHTLNLVSHEGQNYNGTHIEYYSGQGNGETGWAPIMGVSYYQNVSQWCHGEYLYASDTDDDELQIIATRNNDVGFRADDTGATLSTSRYLELYADDTASAEGVIEKTADTDAFQFTTSGGPFWLRADPEAVGPNLALAVSLFDSNDTLLFSNCPQDTLWADLSNNLPAGTYTFRVTGAGRNDPLTNGFSPYASLGYYSITGTVANARLPDRFSVLEHSPNGTVVGTIAPRTGLGDPLAYTITSGNYSNIFALDIFGVLSVADSSLLDYKTLASQTVFNVQFELFVDITDLLNPALTETNRRVVVAVLTAPGPPIILTQPQSLQLAASQTAIFSVGASGHLPFYDPLSFQWFFNGTALAGGTASSLSISDVQSGQAGNYTVVITNSLGAATSTVATLTVTPQAPLLTGQPVSQRVMANTAVTFAASAVGTEPLNFQWQLNDLALANQTNNTLVLSEVGPADAGNYRAVVSNSAGVAASQGAGLTVDTLLSWGWDNYGQTNLPPGLIDVVQVSAGLEHNLALLRNGTIVAWGSGLQTNVPSGLSGVTGISAGGGHSLAVKADGTVVAWGSDSAGQIDVPLGLSNVLTVAAGRNHSLALKSDGTLVAWGSNTNGQCEIPAEATNLVAIAAGANHSLALRGDGALFGWGADDSGQSTTLHPGLTNVAAIAGGEQHSLALKADSTVVVWGSDFYNQAEVPAGLGQITAISAGGYHSLALRADGRVFAWGAGELNQSLFPDFGQSIIPAELAGISAVAAGEAHSLVLAGTGAPFITEPPLSRVAYKDSQVIFRVSATGASPLTFQWLRDSTNIAGATQQVLLLPDATNAGQYQVVVSNAFGVVTSPPANLQLQDQPPSVRIQPLSQVAYFGTPLQLQVVADGTKPFFYQWRFDGEDLPGATNATLTLDKLSMAQSGSYAVVVSNIAGIISSTKATVRVVQVVAWGADSAGQIDVPPGLSGIVQVAGGQYHSLGLRDDGTVAAWGGTNLNFDYGQTAVPPGATNIVALAAGAYHSLALRADGTVLAWGAGTTNSGLNPNYGQAMVPLGLDEVVAIAAGDFHSVALRSDGQVVVWGGATSGSFGVTNVPPSATNVVDIASASARITALKGDGTVISWGPYGPPAQGVNLVAIAPGAGLSENGHVTSYAGLTNVIEVAGSSSCNMARTSFGRVTAWGNVAQNTAVSGLTNAIGIGCGPGHNLVALGDGSLQITRQPCDRKIDVGGQTLLSVNAAGSAPLYFQWYVNGAGLWGNTNFWLRATDLGTYTVVVSNPSEAITSQVASVTLRLPTLTPGAAADSPGLPWANGGNAAWFGETNITHDGIAAAQSGLIGDGQKSILQTVVKGPARLNFWWKVSSEQWFDFLSFSVNGKVQAAISGETDWQLEQFAIPPGSNTLTWTYAKDPSISVGLDAGWLDQVLVIYAPQITQQPASMAAPLGGNLSLSVSAFGTAPLLYQWSKDGTNLAAATQWAFSITNAARSDSGNYSVAVSNPGGTTVSSSAQVLVVEPQKLNPVGWQPGTGFVFLSRDVDGTSLDPTSLAALKVQFSTNLVNWNSLTGASTLTNGSLILFDPNATNFPHRFYRIMQR